MLTLFRFVSLVAFVALLGFPALAQEEEESADVSVQFEAFLSELRAEAVERGISKEVVEAALSDVEPVQRILERDRKQAEFTLTFESYRDRIVSPENVRVGRAKLAKHRPLLEDIAAKYGVQPRFIVAIWGMETRYGAITGDNPILPAVITLSFDRRRSDFFRQQVFAALEMIDRGYIELAAMKGSWAGAMGQPQFMPTSYMAYAADYDGDGRRDIWNDLGDVFASIANYLAEHGWRDDITWGREVRLPKGFDIEDHRAASPSGCRAEKSLSVARILPEWQALGIRRADGRDLPTRPLEGRLVLPDGEGGPAYVVYDNYIGLLRYNCAHLYALTVGVLADRIWDR